MSKDTKKLSNIGVDGTPFFRSIDGIGRYSHDILKAIASQQPEVTFTILGFHGDKPEPALTKDLPSNVVFHYIPLRRRLYQGIFSRLFPVNLAWFIPKMDHIIHLNFTLFPYIKRSGTAHTLFIHDTTFIDIPNVVAKKNLTYLRRRVPWSIKKADAVAVISDFTRSRAVEVFDIDRSKIYMVGTGVQDIYFRKAKKIDGLPSQYILAIGTLEPRKNLESLVRAHRQLPIKEQQAYRLILGGSLGWDNRELQELIKQSDNIQHVGYVDDSDLPALYQQAKLFVFPSLYEGFGIPILEAMASRTPVIANDISLFRSIGKNNIHYVNAEKISELGQTISELLIKPPSSKKLDVAQAHARTYDWNTVASKLWGCIERTAG